MINLMTGLALQSSRNRILRDPRLTPTREGTPGRHDPPLCRYETPRFAGPQKCCNEHAQHVKMCLCNSVVFLKLVF